MVVFYRQEWFSLLLYPCLEKLMRSSIYSENDEEADFSALDCSHVEAAVHAKDRRGCDLSGTRFACLAFLLPLGMGENTGGRAKRIPCRDHLTP
jgi:hypothetical protein